MIRIPPNPILNKLLWTKIRARAMSHLGERTVRIRKVVGSNPFRSTIKSREIK